MFCFLFSNFISKSITFFFFFIIFSESADATKLIFSDLIEFRNCYKNYRNLKYTYCKKNFNKCIKYNRTYMKESDIKKNTVETSLLYLNNTYKFVKMGTISSVGSDNKGNFIVLDETIFYPQGGGQPSDTGMIDINTAGKSTRYDVNFVSFNNGIVHHYVDQNILDLGLEGKPVLMTINPQKRLLHAKAHTSGHLLGCVVEAMAPELIAAKGYHFLNGPYVEFEGSLSSISKEDLLSKTNQFMSEKIASKANVQATEVDTELLKSLRLPSQFRIPSGKNSRVVQIEGFNPVPCGGTHIKNLSELGEVSIRKIQSQKNITKISYSVK